jgi:DNA-binding transcriptional MerR regulator
MVQKYTPEDYLWLGILDKHYRELNLSDKEFRDMLRKDKFPEHIIEEFLKNRKEQINE